MKSRLLLFLAVLFTIISCNSQTTEKLKTVDVNTFSKEIKATSNPQILDVRTPEEFAEGHIDNAININWNGDSFVKDAEKLNKEEAVFVYCRSGRRSLEASKKLEELGFKNIYNLDGGYMKWRAAELNDSK